MSKLLSPAPPIAKKLSRPDDLWLELKSLWISFFAINLRRPRSQPFVGLDNYTHVLSDPVFWDSVARTAMFSVMAVLAVLIIAITLVAALIFEIAQARRRPQAQI